jgi:hypothetical protein
MEQRIMERMKSVARKLNLQLEPEMEKRLAEAVDATGQTKEEIVQAALAAYLPSGKQPASCLELARQLGVLGCSKDGPKDLSTNKRHMEGFGRD